MTEVRDRWSGVGGQRLAQQSLSPTGLPRWSIRFLKRRSSAIPAFLLILILIISATTVRARVFTRWKGSSNVTATLTRFGGKSAYSADIKINGGKAKLSVIGFNDSLGNTVSDFCRILNIPADKNATQNLTPTTTIYILKGSQNTLRLILLKIPEKQKLLAITIEQSNSDYEKSTAKPTRHQIKSIAEFPDSTPEFYAANRETKLAIELSSTSAPAEAVYGFYHQTLKSDGWFPFLSDDAGSIPTMTIYQRNAEIACVLATPTPNETKILLLHKQLSL